MLGASNSSSTSLVFGMGGRGGDSNMFSQQEQDAAEILLQMSNSISSRPLPPTPRKLQPDKHNQDKVHNATLGTVTSITSSVIVTNPSVSMANYAKSLENMNNAMAPPSPSAFVPVNQGGYSTPKINPGPLVPCRRDSVPPSKRVPISVVKRHGQDNVISVLKKRSSSSDSSPPPFHHQKLRAIRPLLSSEPFISMEAGPSGSYPEQDRRNSTRPPADSVPDVYNPSNSELTSTKVCFGASNIPLQQINPNHTVYQTPSDVRISERPMSETLYSEKQISTNYINLNRPTPSGFQEFNSIKPLACTPYSYCDDRKHSAPIPADAQAKIYKIIVENSESLISCGDGNVKPTASNILGCKPANESSRIISNMPANSISYHNQSYDNQTSKPSGFINIAPNQHPITMTNVNNSYPRNSLPINFETPAWRVPNSKLRGNSENSSAGIRIVNPSQLAPQTGLMIGNGSFQNSGTIGLICLTPGYGNDIHPSSKYVYAGVNRLGAKKPVSEAKMLKQLLRAQAVLDRDACKPIILDGFPIDREHWAKAFLQPDVCHAAGVLFKALFTPEEIQNCTLRGRNGTNLLNQEKRSAILHAVGWMKNKDHNPYSFESKNLSYMDALSPEEKMMIEKKVFVERRYQTSRKIRDVPVKQFESNQYQYNQGGLPYQNQSNRPRDNSTLINLNFPNRNDFLSRSTPVEVIVKAEPGDVLMQSSDNEEDIIKTEIKTELIEIETRDMDVDECNSNGTSFLQFRS